MTNVELLDYNTKEIIYKQIIINSELSILLKGVNSNTNLRIYFVNGSFTTIHIPENVILKNLSKNENTEMNEHVYFSVYNNFDYELTMDGKTILKLLHKKEHTLMVENDLKVFPLPTISIFSSNTF